MRTYTTVYSFLAVMGLVACGSPASSPEVTASAAATSTTPPTAKQIAPEEALKAMKVALPVLGKSDPKQLQKLDPASLQGDLSKRFTNVKKGLEDFSFNHSDLGNTNSEVNYVLAAPGAHEFIGYVVWAIGGDDRGEFESGTAAYYTTDGKLLDIESRTSGISDSEDAGDWTGADLNLLADEEKALRAAFTFDAEQPSLQLVTGKSTKVAIDSVPFAKFVKQVQDEVEKSTFAHADQGDLVTKLVSVNGADGKLAGYVLYSVGGDDADLWAAAGYALFSAKGQLLGREISTAGHADTMDDDSGLFAGK